MESPKRVPSGSRHTYRGHRRESYYPIDNAELVELRARQRTFDGAYARTSLGTLGSTIVFLKLFDRRFYRIGLLYCILTALLALTTVVRRKHSRHDFSDKYRGIGGRGDGTGDDDRLTLEGGGDPVPVRIFGRPFVTAGRIVIIISLLVVTIQVTLLAFIFELPHRDA
ncbi:uncharacterized protein EI90DRAFT_3020045 [Cantharellus anzutake]|uniref:uncharacterized protein n=1 Tax=Cantharellus anzutake TaxID=1750568 RepID=UPI001902EB58|nr:uncharacterized protein EI90DRAFT_3020045 [Cantharellus anzutake]KAF8322782.1 hypothetical protein EI90DRAFT_3020045 [Cantharellus anzutake]